MSAVKPSTKEQLIHYLLNHISLGTYDRKFLSSLQTMYVTAQKPVTTNQSNLLSRIILRYKRQLLKHEITVDEANSLPWTHDPIPSLPEFTETHLILVDDELILRSPYKTNFVKDFRKLEIYGKWEQEDRFWRIPANTFTLREVKKCIEHHYPKINYCDQLTALLKDIDSLSEKDYWDPTYVNKNGNFYVAPITESLHNAIEKIPLDIEFKNITRLVSSGINIDSSVTELCRSKYSDKEINFVKSPVATIEYLDPQLSDLLISLEPDLVIFLEYVSSMKPYLKTIKEKLKEYNIKTITPVYSNLAIDMTQHGYIVIVETGISLRQQILPYASKIVQVVNNKPVHIK
jgi:hypothetical protein